MNEDAVDDAEREWLAAHTAANDAADKASAAWRRYSRTADGRPTEFKAAAKPLRPGVKGAFLPIAAMRMK
jgi:anti-sigma factor RsiW